MFSVSDFVSLVVLRAFAREKREELDPVFESIKAERAPNESV